VTAIIAAVVIFPLSSLKHMDSLRYTSFVALFFIFCLGIGVVVKSSKRLSQFGVDPAFDWVGSFSGYFVSLPIVNFAFTFHPSIPPVWAELKDPSPENMNFISLVSVIGCAIFYTILGVFGYLYHYDTTPDNILVAFPDDVLFIGLKLGYSLVIIFSYPVLNYATRKGIDTLLFKQQPPTTIIRYIIESALIIAATYGVAMGVPSIDVVFGYIGSTVGQLVIFINPALFYLVLYRNGEYVFEGSGDVVYEADQRDRRDTSWRHIFTLRKSPAILLIIFGIVAGTVSVIEISRNLQNLMNKPNK